MRSRVVALAAAAFAVGSAVFALSVRAGDPPAAGAPPPAGAPVCPPPQKKLNHPLLNSMVGDWAVTFTASPMTPDGKPEQGTATSKTVLGLDGTALIDDYNSSGMGGMPFVGHGIYRLSDDGKTVHCWWFDSMMPDPMKLSGPVTDTTLELSGPMPGGMGTMKIVEKQVDGGFDWEATIDGKPMMKQSMRKAAK